MMALQSGGSRPCRPDHDKDVAWTVTTPCERTTQTSRYPSSLSRRSPRHLPAQGHDRHRHYRSAAPAGRRTVRARRHHVSHARPARSRASPRPLVAELRPKWVCSRCQRRVPDRPPRGDGRRRRDRCCCTAPSVIRRSATRHGCGGAAGLGAGSHARSLRHDGVDVVLLTPA